MSRRRRGLSREERTLWAAVARTVEPLRVEDAVVEPPPEPEPEPAPPPVVAPVKKLRGKGADTAPPRPVPPPQPPAHPPLHPIERRTLTRVARGTVGIDARIDLHGLTQLDAHDRLRGFLFSAQAQGARLVLVITGKGKAGGDPHYGEFAERGVLRRRVPQWLAEPGLRSIVIGFEEAHQTHGGGGALYVRIRRRRGHGVDEP
ncbi:Smr/MutS family protein [Kaistia dalseonensis]|uniref:DNA-nicking Smr family endonuclease n=1 Tax=Kaistia dalseonensis TaxID=410840 RepID=A0ABU0H7E1_9HYPH|nr:Smr/MutS family protein [Kaistia dalseonensis]MCX5494848.1 Smr/MutS family protein [Kaistia dalseonensis]MDQ0437429.1 DNA-nicking Smr family endonuclease [Kaistia dalseonensis]